MVVETASVFELSFQYIIVSNNFKRKSSNDIPAHELPAAYSLGALEPIAYFYGAMPTGVTVSHKGEFL